jgi:hypothetical protein
LARNSAGTKHTRIVAATMTQSIQEMTMRALRGRGKEAEDSEPCGRNVPVGPSRGNAGKGRVLPSVHAFG